MHIERCILRFINILADKPLQQYLTSGYKRLDKVLANYWHDS